MPLVIADRVRETTSSAGTGTVTLTGAFSGFQPFSVIGDGNTTYYCIIDAAAGAFEVGIGTYTTAGNTLNRNTVLSSSNGGSAVSFAAGLKDVICTQPSARAVYVDGTDVVARNNAKVPNSLLANSGITFGSTAQALGSTVTALNGVTVGATTASTGAFTTLAASGAVTLDAATANGVAFANASKVLTTGSALTFDGNGLNVTKTTATFGVPVYQFNTSAINGAFTGDTTIGTVSLGSYSNHPLAFYLNNTEQMRLTSTGLGIGTSSPGAKLDVVGAGRFTGNADVLTLKYLANGGSALLAWKNEAGTTLWDIGGGIVTAQDELAIRRQGSMVALFNSSGNLGLGVTPSAWSAQARAMQIGIYAGFYQNASGLTAASFNSFQNTSNIDTYRVSANPATKYELGGGHVWYVAPSGTAGNAISFTQAMTLDASGNLYLGATTGARGGSTTRQLIKLGTGQAYVEIQSASTSSTADALMFSDGSTGNYGLVGYDHSNDAMSFYTAQTERARIDSSGNVGIGTSSPTTRLEITGAGTATSSMVVTGSSATNNIIKYGFYATKHYTNATAPLGLVLGETQSTANIVRIGGGYGEVTAATSIEFYTAANNTTVTGSERARIDSSGNLLVGKTTTSLDTPGAQIASNGTIATSFSISANQAVVFNNITAGTSYDIDFRSNGSSRGAIRVNDTSTSYLTSSDYRLKEAVAPMQGALARVAALKPVTYKWKVDGSDGEGFIAHELQAVVPDCVTGEKDAVDADGKPQYQGIDTSFLVATLTAAIQEQQTIITALTARITALESN